MKKKPSRPHPQRRQFIAAAVLAGAPAIGRAQSVPMRIGSWPLAAGLPFYAAVEAGYFKQAGLDVQPQQLSMEMFQRKMRRPARMQAPGTLS